MSEADSEKEEEGMEVVEDEVEGDESDEHEDEGADNVVHGNEKQAKKKSKEDKDNILDFRPADYFEQEELDKAYGLQVQPRQFIEQLLRDRWLVPPKKCSGKEWADAEKLPNGEYKTDPKPCPGENFTLQEYSHNKTTGFGWRCQNYKCKNIMSVRNDSIFESFNQLPIPVVYEMIKCFANYRFNCKKAMKYIKEYYGHAVNKESMMKLYRKLRVIIKDYLDLVYSQRKLAERGQGGIVSIDEAVFSKRYGNPKIYQWVLGMIETTTRRIRLCLIKDRSEAVLKEKILSLIGPKNDIVTDGWSAYSWLDKDKKYNHFVFNHDAKWWGKGVYSSSHIEQLWHQIKSLIKNTYHQIPFDNLVYFLKEAEWKWNTRDLSYSSQMRMLGLIVRAHLELVLRMKEEKKKKQQERGEPDNSDGGDDGDDNGSGADGDGAGDPGDGHAAAGPGGADGGVGGAGRTSKRKRHQEYAHGDEDRAVANPDMDMDDYGNYGNEDIIRRVIQMEQQPVKENPRMKDAKKGPEALDQTDMEAIDFLIKNDFQMPELGQEEIVEMAEEHAKQDMKKNIPLLKQGREEMKEELNLSEDEADKRYQEYLEEIAAYDIELERKMLNDAYADFYDQIEGYAKKEAKGSKKKGIALNGSMMFQSSLADTLKKRDNNMPFPMEDEGFEQADQGDIAKAAQQRESQNKKAHARWDKSQKKKDLLEKQEKARKKREEEQKKQEEEKKQEDKKEEKQDEKKEEQPKTKRGRPKGSTNKNKKGKESVRDKYKERAEEPKVDLKDVLEEMQEQRDEDNFSGRKRQRAENEDFDFLDQDWDDNPDNLDDLDLSIDPGSAKKEDKKAFKKFDEGVKKDLKKGEKEEPKQEKKAKKGKDKGMEKYLKDLKKQKQKKTLETMLKKGTYNDGKKHHGMGVRGVDPTAKDPRGRKSNAEKKSQKKAEEGKEKKGKRGKK